MIGAALPYAVVGLFGAIIPLPIVAQLQPVELSLAMLYGLVTALAFALWPLGRAHDVPVGALFRDACRAASQAAAPHLCRGDRSCSRRSRDARDPARL